MKRLEFNDSGMTQQEWDETLALIARPNLFQSWYFGEVMRTVEGQVPLRFRLIVDGTQIGILQAFQQKLLGAVTLLRVLRGPLFFAPAPPEIHGLAMRALKTRFPLWRLNWTTIMPEAPRLPEDPFSSMGFTRIMEGYETSWLDLTRPLDKISKGLRSNWRNQLQKAREAHIAIQMDGDRDHILQQYSQQKRDRRYGGPSAKLLSAIPAHHSLCIQAAPCPDPSRAGDPASDPKPMAGALFFLHGQTATYQVGWTSPEGRQANASNLVLWTAIERLKERGIVALDLGGIDEARNPGIAHFKQGLGGTQFEAAGVYI